VTHEIFARKFTLWNWQRSSLKTHNEFFFYLVLMLFGGLVNYGIYAWLVFSYQSVAENLIVGLAVVCIAWMFVNYATSKLVLFHQDVNQRNDVED